MRALEDSFAGCKPAPKWRVFSENSEKSGAASILVKRQVNEKFELAGPGKGCTLYSESKLKRK